MSRRSRRRARQRLHRNQRIRGRRTATVRVATDYRRLAEAMTQMGRSAYAAAPAMTRALEQLIELERGYQRAIATMINFAAAGHDVREEHDELEQLADDARHDINRIGRAKWRGDEPVYAEIDGAPICITDDGWCLREPNHTGPHVYRAEESTP